MCKNKSINKRHGSVAVIVGGIILALLISFGAFIKYSTSRQYATKKLNKVLLAREFSSALASLACHQLKGREIRNLSGKLVEALAKPLASMADKTADQVVYDDALKAVISKLALASSELRDLDYSVGWVVQKSDFSPVLNAYSREKSGIIRIPILISYKAPGSEDKITEDYLYSIEVKAVANLIPVLSKFTLYVQDALCGEDSDRFNQTFTDAYGNLNGGSFKPWVLDNGGGSVLPDRFADAIRSPRGLVYLGGGRVVLGLARGWNVPGKYSEGFHLLAEGRGNGLYTTGYVGAMALMNWETGLCNTDPADDASVFWYDFIKSGFADMSRRNSMFRLMGTDAVRSPTVVFGDVMARTLCAKSYRESSANFGPLPYTHSNEQFDDFISGDSEEFDISYFYNQMILNSGTLSRSEYNARYASCLTEEPYNRSLGYMITNFKIPRPLESGVIAASDPLADFIAGKALLKGFAHNIPVPFSSIYNDVKDLKSIDALLSRMQIPGPRSICNITLQKDEKLLSALERNGFLSRGKLDLNGWIFIRAAERIVIDDSLRLQSHGGIVLEKGNIEIKNSITDDGSDFLLNLVALNGNIIIDSSLGGELDIALTASGESSDSGQVKLAGSSSSATPKVNGNIAMRRMGAGSLSSAAARGLEISYRKSLAALPGQEADEGSEKDLLMFNLDSNPRLVD